MGKISSEAEPSINHFSHPHPLQLCNHQPQQTLNLASCSGCKLSVSGFIYTCPTCNYFLHIKCSQMPQQITHPFHQHHIFSLLPKPFYPDGLFNCDACGNEGNGFSYHCKACNFDLHILCASMPLSLSHQSHHHQLNLTFSPPYPNKSFSCDICKNTGSNHWLYRCNFCEFDAHLNCATVQSNQPPMQQIQTTMRVDPVQALTPKIQMGQSQTSRFAPQSSVPNFMNQSGYGLVRPVGMRQNNDIFNQSIQSVLNGGSQSAGQNLMQGILGGGGGGGGQNLLHALMGSGGGGQNLMQGLTGGGGGLNVLQTLIGGGGGGGVGTPNLLQAFMGGGGTGGIDVFGGSGGGGDGGSFPILDTLNGLSGGFQDFSL